MVSRGQWDLAQFINLALGPGRDQAVAFEADHDGVISLSLGGFKLEVQHPWD